MLHCIVQTDMEGGDNEFADGFWAAEQLREKYPQYFKLLTTQELGYWDIGADFTKFFLFILLILNLFVFEFNGHLSLTRR